MRDTYLGFNEKRMAEVYWLPDGWRKYKYQDGHIEIVLEKG